MEGERAEGMGRGIDGGGSEGRIEKTRSWNKGKDF